MFDIGDEYREKNSLSDEGLCQIRCASIIKDITLYDKASKQSATDKQVEKKGQQGKEKGLLMQRKIWGILT